MIESVVLCEGYHDRSFWTGWLERLGCRDARRRADGTLGPPPRDPFGVPVTQGHFAFITPAGSFLRVQPCGGDQKVLRALTNRLTERTTKPLRHLIVNLDDDSVDPPGVEHMLSHDNEILQAVANRVREVTHGRIAASSTATELHIEGERTIVSTIIWSSHDPQTPELPTKQTLERLVCSAIRAAYPERAAAVSAWLRGRPSPPSATPKEHAWSHMAGWFATHNCDDFYQALWRDDAIAQALVERLTSSGAQQIATALTT